jgi:hypothetical protein
LSILFLGVSTAILPSIHHARWKRVDKAGKPQVEMNDIAAAALPHPEEPRAARRLEGWARDAVCGPPFETRPFGPLLRVRWSRVATLTV